MNAAIVKTNNCYSNLRVHHPRCRSWDNYFEHALIVEKVSTINYLQIPNPGYSNMGCSVCLSSPDSMDGTTTLRGCVDLPGVRRRSSYHPRYRKY